MAFMKRSVKKQVAALLLLVLLFVVKADNDSVTKKDEKPKITALSLNVSQPEDRYKAFMSQMERQLALTTTKPHIQKRPVLGQQKFSPDHWFHVTLKGQGHGQCTLAIRADTVYLVGFKTQKGPWYAFKNRNHLIQGSTALSFTDDYSSLAGGGGRKELVNVVVGKKSAQEALEILANYDHASTPDQETKKALLRFVLMLCEAARFQLMRADVSAAWDKAEGGKVREAAALLTVKWGAISCALLGSGKKKWETIREAKEIEKYGDPEMKSAKAAAENVYCILQATDCSVHY